MPLGFTRHARQRMALRKISEDRVRAVLAAGWLESRGSAGRLLYRARVFGILTWVRIQVRGDLVLVVTVWDELSPRDSDG